MPRKSKKQREDEEDDAVYNGIVFQGSTVVSCGEDLGVLELFTNDGSFGVVINHFNAEDIISQLQDFIKGRAPHILKDDN